ncbi:hypothetical protein [Zobellia laminariae]|uniref:hypothetical protein n=1 Tax=Zobellia laminariae TaxID=248906 RepID=UPI0034CE8C3D
MHNTIKIYASVAVLCLSIGCKEDKSQKAEVVDAAEKIDAPKTIEVDTTVIKEMPKDVATPKGMVWIMALCFLKERFRKIKGLWSMRSLHIKLR